MARSVSLALAIVLLISGCAAGIKGRSDSPEYLSNSTSYYAGEIRSALSEAKDFKAEYYQARTGGASEAQMFQARNDFALKMLAAYDLALQDYARSLSVEGRGGKFATTLATIGLTAAATIVSNSNTQSILSGAATALLGIEEGYSKDILLEKTVDFVLVQMTVAHLEARRKILANLDEPVANYPLTAVELDLQGVGRVTSFESALSAINQEAGTRLEIAKATDDSVITARISDDLDDRAVVKLLNGFISASIDNVETYLGLAAREGLEMPPAPTPRSRAVLTIARAENAAGNRKIAKELQLIGG